MELLELQATDNIPSEVYSSVYYRMFLWQIRQNPQNENHANGPHRPNDRHVGGWAGGDGRGRLGPGHYARLAPHNILVYEIRPGIIATDMTAAVKTRYDKLIGEGLVERVTDPEDRRVVEIRITTAGRDVLRDFERIAREAVIKRLSSLSTEDISSLHDSMRNIRSIISKLDQDKTRKSR